MSGDAGIFGPDSVAWRLHADPVMLVGGLRALLVQALEPRAMAAVDQHSKFREDPWGRLERTTNFVLATTYGDTATAEAAAARVRKVHARIHGVDPVTGLPYAANDPDLLLWIHAVEVESFLLAYRTYAGRLSREPTPTATWPRWRASPRWSSCPSAMRAADRGRAARLPALGAGAAGHAGRVRRAARRPVPADAPARTARCGRSRPPPRSRSCPATRAACTGSRGSRRSRCRCAPGCSRSAGC